MCIQSKRCEDNYVLKPSHRKEYFEVAGWIVDDIKEFNRSKLVKKRRSIPRIMLKNKMAQMPHKDILTVSKRADFVHTMDTRIASLILYSKNCVIGKLNDLLSLTKQLMFLVVEGN